MTARTFSGSDRMCRSRRSVAFPCRSAASSSGVGRPGWVVVAIASPRQVEAHHDLLQALVVECRVFAESGRTLPPLGRPGLGFEVERHQVLRAHHANRDAGVVQNTSAIAPLTA